MLQPHSIKFGRDSKLASNRLDASATVYPSRIARISSGPISPSFCPRALPVEVHDLRGDALGDRRAPERPQQVRRPSHLIDERRDGEIEAEPLVTLALTVQRKAVTVLADEDVDHQRIAVLAAGDDFVADRCAHDL